MKKNEAGPMPRSEIGRSGRLCFFVFRVATVDCAAGCFLPTDLDRIFSTTLQRAVLRGAFVPKKNRPVSLYGEIT
jgi:hypothetical protein